jgi:hypothetical protein
MFTINVNAATTNQKVESKEYNSYQILNYNPELVCDNDTETGAYRSVVLDSESKDVLCVAPPKSVTFEYFKESGSVPEINGVLDCLHDKKDTNGTWLQDSHVSSLVITEMVEGTMVNLFYDTRAKTWEIASKGAIGGNYWYFRTNYENVGDLTPQLTFRDMFLDALQAPRGIPLNDVPLLNEMPKTFSYSFVLQHPNNHIVLNITRPTLYLVAAYQVETVNRETGDNRLRTVPLSEIEGYSFVRSTNNVIMFPREVPASDLKYDMLMGNAHIFEVGYMLSDTVSGLRTAIPNPRYKEIKELRGNHPNLQYQYFALFQAGKVREFLEYFPGYNNLFYQFHLQSMKFIQEVHDAYVSYYIKKRGQQVRIHKSVFHHIYKLHHEVYLPSLEAGEPTIVTRKVVSEYFNGMEPKEKLYHVNYKMREPVAHTVTQV